MDTPSGLMWIPLSCPTNASFSCLDAMATSLLSIVLTAHLCMWIPSGTPRLVATLMIFPISTSRIASDTINTSNTSGVYTHQYITVAVPNLSGRKGNDPGGGGTVGSPPMPSKSTISNKEGWCTYGSAILS